MAEWLSIIGIGEDGADGLTKASRNALEAAQIVFGGPRHLAMITHPDKRPWPVPFSLAPLLALRGQPVAMLVSGDPFWHGAGGVLATQLPRGEWRAFPAPSTFTLAAARLGWKIEETLCLGLHAAPLSRLRPELAPGRHALVTLRDGAAVRDLAAWLTAQGFGATRLHVMENLGGPRECVTQTRADLPGGQDIAPLVMAGLEIEGGGEVIARSQGLPDRLFDHDGQITKRPLRALALSALAPRSGELLWDLGAGSGSIGIEWLLADPTTRCVAIERNPTRAARICRNAENLGVSRLDIRQGEALDLLGGLPDPDAVFIGGGANEVLLQALWTRLRPPARIVAHAVTLETESLLLAWQAAHGGTLLRIALSEPAPIGQMRGWKASYPVLQWVVNR